MGVGRLGLGAGEAAAEAIVLRTAEALGGSAWTPGQARLGEAAGLPEPDARPLNKFPRPAVDAFLVFVAALPEVGAAAA